MSTRKKVFLGIGGVIALGIALAAFFPSQGRNEEFKPQGEFELLPWVHLEAGGIDLSITKGVLYLAIACVLTTVTMVYIAKRMEDRPNRVQTAVEWAYSFASNDIAGANLKDPKMMAKWFPFIAALFFFILFSNMIGYIPLPVNTEHPLHIFGLEVPALAIYAATANLSIPLVLTLLVWFSYHAEGTRVHGFRAYIRGWVPAGVTGAARIPLFAIEVISQLVRIISLSVRLFANLLAGHLLILFMGGGLVVILGTAAIGAFTLPVAILFFMFEVGLIAGLQAFIFATLTAIYLGEATAESH